MSYPLIGANATINSWGSGNFNSTLLAWLTNASANIQLVNNGVDITGLGSLVRNEIPGMISANATLGGYVRATSGGTPFLATAGGLAAVSGLYTAASIQSFAISLRTDTVTDMTAFNSATPPAAMLFRPGIFMASARYTAMVDSSTALTAPSRPGDALPTAVFTIGPSSTLTMTSANVRVVSAVLQRGGQKQLVTYQMNSTTTVGASGGPFGTRTFGSTNNADPFWSAGGAATGALDAYMITGGAQKIGFADSFWTSIDINLPQLNAPVGYQIGIQASGAISINGSVI